MEFVAQKKRGIVVVCMLLSRLGLFLLVCYYFISLLLAFVRTFIDKKRVWIGRSASALELL